MTSVGTPWQNLALSGTPMRREFRVLNATVTVAAGIVLYALDSEGYYHLLLPVTTDTLVPPDRRSAGVHILPLVLEEEHTKAYFIDVACRKLTLNEVFTHLADDILSVLGSDASDPVATCRRVLARWRELIEREAASRLSREALAGLFAELYQLRRLMERNPESLSRWAGPLGGRHDFEAGQTALEVKASLRRDGRFFEVHGVEQLAPPYLGALFVAAMKLEIGDAGGESVPKVIQDIMTAVRIHATSSRSSGPPGTTQQTFVTRSYGSELRRNESIVCTRTSPASPLSRSRTGAFRPA